MSELEDPEMVSTPLDQNIQGLPREGVRRNGRAMKIGRGAVWSPKQSVGFGLGEDRPQVPGIYPRGFLTFALDKLRAGPMSVLHVCSGALGRDAGGVRVDLRAAVRPDVLADGRRLPFRDESFPAVLIDPPWSVEYAEKLYGTDYPRPGALLNEAARVVKPGGRIGFLHFFFPRPPRGTSVVDTWAITVGCGYRVRLLAVYEKAQRGLFDS